MFKEEGVEAMMDVVLEMFDGTCLGQYLFDDMLMVLDYLVKRVGSEIVACLQVQVLAEREAT